MEQKKIIRTINLTGAIATFTDRTFRVASIDNSNKEAKEKFKRGKEDTRTDAHDKAIKSSNGEFKDLGDAYFSCWSHQRIDPVNLDELFLLDCVQNNKDKQNNCDPKGVAVILLSDVGQVANYLDIKKREIAYSLITRLEQKTIGISFNELYDSRMQYFKRVHEEGVDLKHRPIIYLTEQERNAATKIEKVKETFGTWPPMFVKNYEAYSFEDEYRFCLSIPSLDDLLWNIKNLSAEQRQKLSISQTIAIESIKKEFKYMDLTWDYDQCPFQYVAINPNLDEESKEQLAKLIPSHMLKGVVNLVDG